MVENNQKQKMEKEIKEVKTAIVRGRNIPISTKQAMGICNFIRGNYIETAIFKLGEVIKKKKAVPMKGEIPHRKGIMSGNYPIKASNEFIKLLNSLKANAIYKDLELEKYKIACKADIATRPQKRFGQGRIKRSHVTIKLVGKKDETRV